MAIVKVDDQTIDTAFIQEYLKRPANDPVRLAAEKWQAQQAAKVRRAQAAAAPKTTKPSDKKAEGIKKSEEIVVAGRAKAKAETIAQQRKANERARAGGAALPFPNVGPAPADGQGGIPGAGRGTRTTPTREIPGIGPATSGSTSTRKTVENLTPTTTVTDTEETGDIGRTGGTGEAAGVDDTADKTPKVPKTPKAKREAGQDALAKAGINQAIIQYMKENYPADWAEIKLLRDKALETDGEIGADEQRRIDTAFKNSEYFKNGVREKYRTEIGATFLANGLDTVSNAAFIDKLTDEAYITKIKTPEQVSAEIRRTAVDKLGLNRPDADQSKKEIARAMLDLGQNFMTAAKSYTDTYRVLMDIPENQFDPFEDAGFLTAFNASTSFADFRVKAKASPTYANSLKGRQEINSTKLQLQQLTRNLGLGYNPQQLETQAVNVISGKETFEQLEYSLRSIAGEAFPAFKDRILAGETVTSIAAPYVSSMSRILEIPDSAIDISNPNNEIRKALIGNGTNSKPLWQFEQELFKDARWQYTSNARNTIDQVSMDILQRFGVMG